MLLEVLNGVVLNRQVVAAWSINAILSTAGAVACELREIAVRTANAVVARRKSYRISNNSATDNCDIKV